MFAYLLSLSPPYKGMDMCSCLFFLFVPFLSYSVFTKRRRRVSPFAPFPWKNNNTFPGHNPGETMSLHLQLTLESWLELRPLDWGRFQNIMSVLWNISLNMFKNTSSEVLKKRQKENYSFWINLDGRNLLFKRLVLADLQPKHSYGYIEESILRNVWCGCWWARSPYPT